MALQMGVAVGVAFAAGRLIWPSHWTWTVLTAFIVCSGARSRGDVIHKGALRILGAGVGTVLGTLIASTFAPLDHTSVVVIFAVLAVGTWLRPFSYAYWAASVTAVLSLLYGYFGASATSLLHTRLEAILLGALIGIASSWMVLPTRSSDVLRSRLAAVLAALSDLLKPGPRDRATLTRQQARFDHSVHLLEQIAAPFEAHRRVTRHRRAAPGNAETFDAIRRSIAPVHALIQCANNDDVLASPRVARVQSVIAGNIGAVRRQIAGMPGSDHRPLPRTLGVPEDNPDAESSRSSPTSTAQLRSSREPFPLAPPQHQRGRSQRTSTPLAFSTNAPTAGWPREGQHLDRRRRDSGRRAPRPSPDR